MPLLNTCCFRKSVRDGSFVSGIYTMIFYTLVVTLGSFHLTPGVENKILFSFGLLALCLSGLCVLSSALLLVGLCADNPSFLLPWLVCVSITTLLDIFLSFYFIVEDSRDPLLRTLFVTDFFVSALNIYSLTCVLSQYQEYNAGRGRPEDCTHIEPRTDVPCIPFKWPSFPVLNQTASDPSKELEIVVLQRENFSADYSSRDQLLRSSFSGNSGIRIEIRSKMSYTENSPSVLSEETESASIV